MENTIKKYGPFFTSSVDLNKMAATIEGAMLTVGSFLVFIGFFDAATETTLMSNVNGLLTDATILIPLASTMIGLCWSIFGLIRKAVVQFTKKTTSTASVTVAPSLPVTPIVVAQDPTVPVVQ